MLHYIKVLLLPTPTIFQNWHHGEGQQLDHQTPWAYWACNGDDWTWQESQIGPMKDYMQPWFTSKMPAGLLFGTLALLLWAAHILKEFRSIGNYVLLAGMPA